MQPTLTMDVGTTSVKLAVFDEAGRLGSARRIPTPTVVDADGEIYDTPALLRALDEFVLSLVPRERSSVRRIAITGVGESGGLVLPDLTLASPMILWHDQRGAGILARLDATARTRIYRATGLPASANYGLSKAAWALARAGSGGAGATWLNIAEYIGATLTGERASEYSLASRTMALDVLAGSWSDEVCALLGVDPGVFPPLRSAATGQELRRDVASRLGLASEVAVHVAGHDHMVGGVGAGLLPGQLLNSTGTTEGLLLLNDRPELGVEAEAAMLANGLAPSGGLFTLFASIPTGGAAFSALCGLLGLGADELEARIAAIADRYVSGAVDLARIPLVLPRFRGSPPPTKVAADRASISGLDAETTADDIVTGCFMGMALQFLDVLELFPLAPEVVKVIGPARRNPLWLQLKADLLDTPLQVSGFDEVVSRGAQALASGTTASWAANEPREVRPDAARHDRLRNWRESVLPRWEHMKAMPA